FDRPRDENDALLEETRKDVVGPFAAVGLLDHHRHEIHVGFDGIFQSSPSFSVSQRNRGTALRLSSFAGRLYDVPRVSDAQVDSCARPIAIKRRALHASLPR